MYAHIQHIPTIMVGTAGRIHVGGLGLALRNSLAFTLWTVTSGKWGQLHAVQSRK